LFDTFRLLSEGSKIFLEIPLGWKTQFFRHQTDLKFKLRKEYVPIPIKYAGKHLLEGIELDPKSKAKLRLLVFIPEKFKKNEYLIAVRQIWKR
jgi:hypothetical protein